MVNAHHLMLLVMYNINRPKIHILANQDIIYNLLVINFNAQVVLLQSQHNVLNVFIIIKLLNIDNIKKNLNKLIF